jgi:hypothetical protein
MVVYRLVRNIIDDTIKFILSLFFVWLLALITIIYSIVNYAIKEKTIENKKKFVKILILTFLITICLTLIITKIY